MDQSEPHERYGAALDLAWAKLGESNLRELVEGAGGSLQADEISLPNFDQSIIINVKSRSMRTGPRELGISDRILALHYLLGCDRSRPTGNLISFAQAPGGDVYFSAFKKRSIDRLAEMFGDSPERLIKAGSLLGGEPLQMATAAIKLPVYPMLPIVVLIWQGDDEVEPAANLLFDESAVRILTTEDLAMVASSAVSRLAQALQAVQ
ncbi:MAG: DUF3786 domain-containing protein [Methanomassiliicoccales archaeon]|nr:DUF3786 domain-containing protein [Methanomassiliicoccales archaeon]